MKFSGRTLQAKLLVSVFLIVCLTVTLMTGLVIYVEKNNTKKMSWSAFIIRPMQ